MREYDLIADWYAGDRGRTSGVPEALALVKPLPGSSLVLDVGCGNGVPLTEAVVAAGHHAVGIDSSSEMLRRFRDNLPSTPVILGDVRDSPFSENCFDAAISWGMMFHLPVDQQSRALDSIGRALKPGACFLFTGAEIEGADPKGITGTMNGVTFRYYAAASYSSLLRDNGFDLLDIHSDQGENTYFLARKRP